MLPTKNRTISVSRLTASGEKRIFSSIITGLQVYINQTAEEQMSGYDNQPSFYAHRMFTEGNHVLIDIGDRITDDTGRSYDVRGKSVHSSIVGTHHQYLITEAID